MEKLNALSIAHGYLQNHIKAGDLCIDATMGRGRDTALLAELVGDSGKVISFDIQPEAVASTQELLIDKNLINRAELVLDSHSNMDKYAKEETVSAITFNLGWLPGGDHSIFTKPGSSIEAIEKGIKLLKNGGIITICIYYGRDCGYKERDEILEFLPTLNHKEVSVLVTDFANRPNDPPIPVYIRKEKL